MTLTDPIADMLTRIRNANMVGKETVSMPTSKKLVEIARVMAEEGYITRYEVVDGEPRGTLEITLKYGDKRPRRSVASSASPSRACVFTLARTSCPACSAASAPPSYRRARA